MTNPNNLMSQDGGDGEHASVAVNNALRDVANNLSPSVGDISSWNMRNVGEVDAGPDHTRFSFDMGNTTFFVEVTRGDAAQ